MVILNRNPYEQGGERAWAVDSDKAEPKRPGEPRRWSGSAAFGRAAGPCFLKVTTGGATADGVTNRSTSREPTLATAHHVCSSISCGSPKRDDPASSPAPLGLGRVHTAEHTPAAEGAACSCRQRRDEFPDHHAEWKTQKVHITLFTYYTQSLKQHWAEGASGNAVS